MYRRIIISTIIYLSLVDVTVAIENNLSDEEMFNKAYESGIRGDYNTAIYWYNKLVDLGYAGAENNLGYMYKSGFGVKQDYYKAVELYKKAAEKNYVEAQVNLAFMYSNGLGVDLDYHQAAMWYQKAADAEHALGQYNLGVFYENGLGVKKDRLMALSLFSRSCSNKHRKSCDRYKYLNYNHSEACKESLSIIASSLSGTWKSMDPDIDAIVSYDSSGKFYGNIKQDGEIVWKYAGVWNLADNKLHYTYTESSLPDIPVGTQDVDVIIKIGCNIKSSLGQEGGLHKSIKITNEDS